MTTKTGQRLAAVRRVGARLLPWARKETQAYPAPDPTVERMNAMLRAIARKEGIAR